MIIDVLCGDDAANTVSNANTAPTNTAPNPSVVRDIFPIKFFGAYVPKVYGTSHYYRRYNYVTTSLFFAKTWQDFEDQIQSLI